jgi:hypothetical protein
MANYVETRSQGAGRERMMMEKTKHRVDKRREQTVEKSCVGMWIWVQQRVRPCASEWCVEEATHTGFTEEQIEAPSGEWLPRLCVLDAQHHR